MLFKTNLRKLCLDATTSAETFINNKQRIEINKITSNNTIFQSNSNSTFSLYLIILLISLLTHSTSALKCYEKNEVPFF